MLNICDHDAANRHKAQDDTVFAQVLQAFVDLGTSLGERLLKNKSFQQLC